MSILIKGLDMPGVFCGADIVLYEGINGSGVPRKYKISADQVVHVPPHGRLVDADALEDYVIALKRDEIHAYEWIGKSGEWNTRITERERFVATIEDAPTVIEAEEGKT